MRSAWDGTEDCEGAGREETSHIRRKSRNVSASLHMRASQVHNRKTMQKTVGVPIGHLGM